MGTLVKSTPSVFREFPSLFEDIIPRDFWNWSLGNNTNGGTLPAVNIRETRDNYELEVAAPGMTRDDFQVELDNDMLVISAEMKDESEQQMGGDYTRREFQYRSFKRSFRLPEHMVENDKISAQYQDGILHITIPKSEEARVKPPKKIKIG